MALRRVACQTPGLLKASRNVAASMVSRRSIVRWSVEKDPRGFDGTVPPASKIINEAEINDCLARTKEAAKNPDRVREVLQIAQDNALLKNTKDVKTEYVQGLTLEQAATLLNVDSNDPTLMKALFDTAGAIKQKIYGNRVVLFAPLYLSNHCVNQCTYCAFNHNNKEMERCITSDEELRKNVEALERMGHKRVLLLTGESPKYTFEQLLNAIKIVSSVKAGPCGSIRRINVEIPPLSISDFVRLKKTGVVGTFTLFQETYHQETYRKYHIGGPKADYQYRLQTLDRAQLGGLDDVGMGALLGLYDYRFEVLGMLSHAQHLDRTYKAGPHTISVPRIQVAAGAETSTHIPYPVNDQDFRKLVAILRCSVPYTGMILSTRESMQMRKELLNLGISQISAGSRVDIGGYDDDENKQRKHDEEVKKGQFSLQDERTLDEIVKDLLQSGFVPSWCTACYRLGRTGEAFMKIAKCGDIHNFCHPNALLTLKEYLLDYASKETKALGEKVIAAEKEVDLSQTAKQALGRKMEKVIKGSRNEFF